MHLWGKLESLTRWGCPKIEQNFKPKSLLSISPPNHSWPSTALWEGLLRLIYSSKVSFVDQNSWSFFSNIRQKGRGHKKVKKYAHLGGGCLHEGLMQIFAATLGWVGLPNKWLGKFLGSALQILVVDAPWLHRCDKNRDEGQSSFWTFQPNLLNNTSILNGETNFVPVGKSVEPITKAKFLSPSLRDLYIRQTNDIRTNLRRLLPRHLTPYATSQFGVRLTFV